MNILLKTLILFCLATTICMSCENAEEPEVDLKRTVKLDMPGSLSTVLTVELKSIINLTLSGTMDARDFKTIRDHMFALDTLDLSAVTIAAYLWSATLR